MKYKLINMKLEPIEYNGGIIWVDKTKEVFGGDICFDWEQEYVHKIKSNSTRTEFDWLIVAQSPNLSIPNITYVEVEVEDWSDDRQKDFSKFWLHEDDKQQCTTSYAQKIYNRGYKAASAKKYNEEDLKRVIE
jgi:hypothetical protein